MGWKNSDSVIESMTNASEIFKRYQNPNANETFGELYPIIAKGNPKLQDILAYQSSESGNLRDLPQNEKLEELLKTIGEEIGSNGDSTMVTPYDALLELLPEYESLGQIDKLNFFKEGRESIIKDVPAGAGFNFLQSLVPRAKRGK